MSSNTVNEINLAVANLDFAKKQRDSLRHCLHEAEGRLIV